MLSLLICKSSTGPNLTWSRPPANLRTQLPQIYHNVILPFLTGLASKCFPTHFSPRNSACFSRIVTLLIQSAFFNMETVSCTDMNMSSKLTT